MLQNLSNGFVFLVFVEVATICRTLNEAKEFRITENPSLLAPTTKARNDASSGRGGGGRSSDLNPINCSQATDSKAALQTVSLETGYDSVAVETSRQPRQPRQPDPVRICRNTETEWHPLEESGVGDSSSNYDDDDEKNDENDGDEKEKNSDDDADDKDEKNNGKNEKKTETRSDQTRISPLDYDSDYPSSSSSSSSSTWDEDKSSDYNLNNGNYDVYPDGDGDDDDDDDDGDDDDDDDEDEDNNQGKESLNGKGELQRKSGEESEYDEEEDDVLEEEDDDETSVGLQVQSRLFIPTNSNNNSTEESNSTTTTTELSYVDVGFDYDYNKRRDETVPDLSSVDASNRNSPADHLPIEDALQISRSSSSNWTEKKATAGDKMANDRVQSHRYHVFSLAWLEDENFVSNFTIFVWIVAAFIFVVMATAFYRYRRYVTSLVDLIRCGYRRRDGIISHETVNGVQEESNNLLAHVQV